MSDDPTPNHGDLQPGAELGRFRIIRKLGQGGMGVVYEAEDQRLRRRVALKLLPASVVGDAARKRRLLREARSASAAQHPSIAAVFEVGEADGTVYLAMELVPGETLRELLARRGGALPLREALRIGAGVARGLAKAHEAGVVHRDLKPDNVMVSDDGTAKILDFGLSKMRAREEPEPGETRPDTVTMEGRVTGTPSYMSPEQAKGRSVDARTDIFSLGVMLYELVTGARPFRGGTALEVIISIDRDDPPLASAVNPSLPGEVDAILAKCIAKRPEDRYSSAEELAQALEGALLVEGKGLRKKSGFSQWMKWAGVAAVAGAALTVAYVFAFRSSLRGGDAPAPSSISLAQSTSPPAQAPSSPASVAPITSSSALPRPLRHPCPGDTEEAKTKCAADQVAWCDTAERVIACCEKNLVAVGRDGLCACPAGGCDPNAWKEPDTAAIQAIVRAKFDDLRDCYAAALRKSPEQAGRVAIGFELTPDGDVFRARIDSTTFPDVEMQACALSVARRLKFPAPSKGTETINYPLIFSPGTDE